MTAVRRLVVAALGLVPWLGACAGNFGPRPELTAAWPRVAGELPPAADPEWERPEGHRMELGEPGPQGEWAPGNRAVFRIDQLLGDVIQRTWFLEVYVFSAFDRDSDREDPRARYRMTGTVTNGEKVVLESPLEIAEVTVRDGAGQELDSGLVQLPRVFLEAGFEEGLREAREMPKDGVLAPGYQPKEALRSVACLLSLLQVIQNQDALEDLLWALVQKPSLGSILWNGGVTIGVSAGLDEARIVADAPEAVARFGDCSAFPVTLSANDEPALYMEWFVVPAVRPVTVTGGVVALTGSDPGDPRRRMVATLVRAVPGIQRPADGSTTDGRP